MAKFGQQVSLSRDFLIFSIAVFMAIIALFCVLWFQTYQHELKKKHDQLRVEASRINMVVSDSISYISQYAAFIGEKISQHNNANDIKYIASLIEGKYIGRPQQQNFYFTTTFDWVTPDKMLRTSNKIGVLEKPFDMSDRDYLERTPKHPWTLQMSKPRIGGLSGKWILPAGMGITDEKGKFLGSITLGFSLGGLEKKIAEARIPPDVHYIILTEDFFPVLNSDRANSKGIDPDFSLSKKTITKLSKISNKYLKTPVIYKNIEYDYIEKVNGYPYLILTGYDNKMPDTLFDKIFISRLAELLTIIIAALAALFLLRRRLIQPVVELAQNADMIRKGHRVKSLNSPIAEIALLDHELLQISDYIHKEQLIMNQLNQKTTELKEAHYLAVKANHAKSEFLANMSHELRTPMNAVIGLSHILAMSSPLTPKQTDYIKTLQMSGNTLLALINDLLDVSKIESSSVDLEKISFDMHQLLNEVVNIIKIKAKEKGLVITLNAYCIKGKNYIGDPTRIKQIFMNLCSNAVKFTENGSVSINVICNEENNHDTEILTIEVTDTGIGIPEDKLQTIFEKFVQADSSINRRYGGTGLGLAITKTLVGIMGGTIETKSAISKGSTFIVTLPLIISKEDKDNTMLKCLPEIKNTNTKINFGILLVEDNAPNIMVATSYLSEFGYNYEVANNGTDAIEKVKKGGFGIILMDVQMPGISGLETTLKIREYEKELNLSPCYIIGMTAHALKEDKERCISAGMNDYISKPFNPEDLKDKLNKVFN